MMWREEVGIVEMLFTYIGHYQEFTGWKSWRSILVDILSSHEELRQRGRECPDACPDGGHGGEVSQHEKDAVAVENGPPPTYGFMASVAAMANPELWTHPEPPATSFHGPAADQQRPVFSAMPEAGGEVWPCVAVKVEADDDVLLIPNSEGDVAGEETGGGDAGGSQSSFMECPDSLQLPRVQPLDRDPCGSKDTHEREQSPPKRERKSGGGSSVSSGGKKAFQCSYCSKVCSTRIGKVVHERTHTGEKPFQCSYCPKTFSQLGNKAVHERIHTGEKPFACAFCPKTFNQLGSKKVHERIHSGEKPYSCRVCSQTFRYAGSRIAHEKTHGVDRLGKFSFAKTISLSAQRMRHVEATTSAGAGAGPSRPTITVTNKRVRKRPDKKRSIPCRFCLKTFHRNSEMRVHERIHTGYKPFTCAFCPKSFTRSSDRLNHERVHTGDKPFACSFCSKTFIKSSDKSRHEQIHLGIKPFKCSYCAKSFCRSSDKIRHERCHTGERPFKCSFCPKSFNRKTHKIDHERTHIVFKVQQD